MNEDLLTTPTVMGNNTSATTEMLVACFHDDDTFKYRAYTFTYLLVFPVAFLCNIGALTVFFLQSNRRNSPSYVVMMNLAISDGSFSLTLPLRLAYYFRGGVWDFPDWLCRLCVFGFYVNLYTSILFLTLLSILRWLAVARPLRHRSLATPTRSLLVCLGVWLFVGVSSAPFLSNGVTNRIVQRLTAPSGLHGSGPSSNVRLRNRRRSVHLVAMVTATFLLCFLPYHLIRSLHLHAVCGRWSCGVVVALQRAVVVTLCLAASNSVVNPLLYYYSTRTFRDKMRDAHSSLLSSRPGSFRSGLAMMRRRNTS
ncbi:cysteinyl leukotriene receptor 1-like isoform X2 [Seriola dumerili]|uniref:cysteinyl leukotriene receptor 1-like isoform X2 n=1 Tax=Seriola dumerili TaxID=41447 RepID=UPI000BBF34EA|nr:cysteinyl leukotriene receptor 1-like isoform X2 [Seriola dumerili]